MNDSHGHDDGAIILKRDRRGRVRMARERREGILDEFERSAMSGADFARHHGIPYQTFAAWRVKRRREKESVQLESEPVGPGTVGSPDSHGRRRRRSLTPTDDGTVTGEVIAEVRRLGR